MPLHVNWVGLDGPVGVAGTVDEALPTGTIEAMVHITGKYLGGLRTEAVHGPSGSKLITDAPVDNHGKGEAFSPTDLLATSLGACMMTVMGIVAERNGLDLNGSTFSVTKEMSSAAPRRVAKLTLTFTLPAGLGEESRTRLEMAAKACPVHHSIHPDIACSIAFDYR